jgi:dTDP-4-dehydrorhamnose 3,5-epimerase
MIKKSQPQLLKIDTHSDIRGEFNRLYCKILMQEKGLEDVFVQTNVSTNKVRGTVRGIHYQQSPNEEAKLVSCIQGSLFDVVVDVREDSSTKGKVWTFTLSPEDGNTLYIPKGFAHGFQTLEDNVIVIYHMSEFYKKDHAKTYNWRSLSLNIQWPLECTQISEKDDAAQHYEAKLEKTL